MENIDDFSTESHDPSLRQLVADIGDKLFEPKTLGTLISFNATSSCIPTSIVKDQDPTKFECPANIQKQMELPTIIVEDLSSLAAIALSVEHVEDAVEGRLSGFENPEHVQNEIELPTIIPEDLTSLTEIAIGHDNQTVDGRPIELPHYSDPKHVAYWLLVYLKFMGLVALKFKDAPFPFTSPFMIFSVITYSMALLNLAILFGIYDHLKSSPHQHFSPRHYLILIYVFYILSIVAPFSLLPLLFNPHH